MSSTGNRSLSHQLLDPTTTHPDDDHPGLRLNDLNGSLEIWMPKHGKTKKRLARQIEAFAEEFDLELNDWQHHLLDFR